MQVLFDDALPILIEVLREWGGESFVEQGTVLFRRRRPASPRTGGSRRIQRRTPARG
jgi:hypothetical protein